MKFAGKAGKYKRKAVVMAGGAAVLGAAPMLAMTHGHRGLGSMMIGIQLVLIVLAMRYLVKMKKVRAARE